MISFALSQSRSSGKTHTNGRRLRSAHFPTGGQLREKRSTKILLPDRYDGR